MRVRTEQKRRRKCTFSVLAVLGHPFPSFFYRCSWLLGLHVCGRKTISLHNHCITHVPSLGQNGDCLLQTPLRDCLIISNVHSNVSQHPSPSSHYVLVPGTGCGPDLFKHVK